MNKPTLANEIWDIAQSIDDVMTEHEALRAVFELALDALDTSLKNIEKTFGNNVRDFIQNEVLSLQLVQSRMYAEHEAIEDKLHELIELAKREKGGLV